MKIQIIIVEICNDSYSCTVRINDEITFSADYYEDYASAMEDAIYFAKDEFYGVSL